MHPPSVAVPLDGGPAHVLRATRRKVKPAEAKCVSITNRPMTHRNAEVCAGGRYAVARACHAYSHATKTVARQWIRSGTSKTPAKQHAPDLLINQF